MIFQWNEWNREHVAKHDVTPDEAQYVVNHARRPFPRGIDDREFLVWEQTQTGRYLQVIYVYVDDPDVDLISLSPTERIRFQDGESVVFVVHARELTEDEKRSYRRRKRRPRP